MAKSVDLYEQGVLTLHKGGIDLSTMTISLRFLSDSYTPDLETDQYWTDVSTYELTTADGYTAGGKDLTTVSCVVSSGYIVLDADDLTWTALTKAIEYGVVVVDDGVDEHLLALITLQDSPSAVDYTVQWSSLGILRTQIS